MAKKLVFALVFVSFELTSLLQAQTLRPLANQPPNGTLLPFLLTDGSVVAQDFSVSGWWKLTPDNFGSYHNGTWSQLADLPSGYAPLSFASAVLADGRVLLVGGEYNDGTSFALTNKGAVYDPLTDRWTRVRPPSGWRFIGDSPSVVLPNGKFLIGNKLDTRIAALDPATLTWDEMGFTGKGDLHAEEGWTLLPDGTVLTVDVKNAPIAEKYLPWKEGWVTAGGTIVDLHSSSSGCIPYGSAGQFCYYPPGEVGSATLRPDGTVFATGARSADGVGHTAIYTPPAAPSEPGTWVAGPDFPNEEFVDDTFAVLLPNGHVLVQTSGLKLFEFDGVNLTLDFRAIASTFLLLPTGEVLVAGPLGAELFTPADTSFSPDWAPRIKRYPTTVSGGSTYTISGEQFNGLSQACGMGDELVNATNYPLVRIANQNTGHVLYARTHDHSTMAVATGNTSVFTHFDVPAGIETGASTLVVVANGIPSAAVNITVK